MPAAAVVAVIVTSGQAVERDEDLRRAQRRQLVVQFACGALRADRHGRLEQHVAGIEPLIHLHDRDAGHRIAGKDGALDRRGAAPSWQQRGMDVEAAQSRQLQHRRGRISP